MKLYRVSRIMGQGDMLRFLENNMGVDVKVEALPEEQGATQGSKAIEAPSTAPEPIYQPARGPRLPRRSKVADAIIGSLEKGAGTITDLKAALEEAGMSASSLSTGLAALQKADTITRDEHGHYRLAAE